MLTCLVASLIVIPAAQFFPRKEKRDCVHQARVELFVSRGAFDFLATWQRRKDSLAVQPCKNPRGRKMTLKPPPPSCSRTVQG